MVWFSFGRNRTEGTQKYIWNSETEDRDRLAVFDQLWMLALEVA